MTPITTPKLNLTYTATGSVAVSTAQKVIGDYSCYLPGSSSNRLIISNFPGSTYLSNNWTIEFFIYLPNPNDMASTELSPITFSSAPASSGTMLIYPAYFKSRNTFAWFVGISSKPWEIANNQYSSTPSTEGWNHLAICYTLNTNYQFFCNGSLIGTSTKTTNVGSLLTNINLGTLAINNANVMGGYNTYVDGLRISDTVRYTSSYTVPTAYTVDSNTIYLNSFEGSFES